MNDHTRNTYREEVLVSPGFAGVITGIIEVKTSVSVVGSLSFQMIGDRGYLATTSLEEALAVVASPMLPLLSLFLSPRTQNNGDAQENNDRNGRCSI